MLHLVRHGGPALCNIAVTNACNATCDFCNFANGKVTRADLRWIDAEQLERALLLLYGRGIRYVSFFGGEPLLHPQIAEMAATAVRHGMGTALITNGWLLPSKLDELASSGLQTIYISIDAPSIISHERNRGLTGLGERVRSAVQRMPSLGLTPIAQVTISKLVDDYAALVALLRELGFSAVAFSYPQRARLGSSSLAWSSDSQLMNFTDLELARALDNANDVRDRFTVNNPAASMADMKRHVQGVKQRFVCYAGFKSFYMDWNFDVWRCDSWRERMCSVWDFAEVPFVRDGCTACMSDCYRDSSVMLHFAVSLSDALDCAGEGHILRALKMLADRRNLESLGAIAKNARVIRHLAKLG